VQSWMRSHAMGVCCIQEYAGVDEGCDGTGRWGDWFLVATACAGRRMTAILVAPELSHLVQDFARHPGGTTEIALRVANRNLSIFAVHLQPASMAQYAHECAVLESLLRARAHWILGIDANTDLSHAGLCSLPDNAFPGVLTHEQSDRGEILGATLLRLQAQVPQFQFGCLDATHHSWATASPSVKDFIMCSPSLGAAARCCAVLPDLPLVSDHYAVIADFAVLSRPAKRGLAPAPCPARGTRTAPRSQSDVCAAT